MGVELDRVLLAITGGEDDPQLWPLAWVRSLLTDLFAREWHETTDDPPAALEAMLAVRGMLLGLENATDPLRRALIVRLHAQQARSIPDNSDEMPF